MHYTIWFVNKDNLMDTMRCTDENLHAKIEEIEAHGGTIMKIRNVFGDYLTDY